MKYYRVRTQNEWDWLMQKLEDEGCFWANGRKPTELDYSKQHDVVSVGRFMAKEIWREEFKKGATDQPIIEVSDLMDTVDHDTLMQKVVERNNKPEKLNTGDPWIDNLPESYFEMYEEESLKELTEPLDLINQHKRICERLNKVYADKNHDYGNSFGDTFEKYGDISALVRISDKMNRIEQLVQTGEQKVKDEALEDSILDMANYLIMWAMELEEEK